LGAYDRAPSSSHYTSVCVDQIVPKNTLIVAAGKSDNDDNVDEGLYLAREAEIDPNGSRTLRAYTFWKQAREVRQNQIKDAIAKGSVDNKPHVLDLKVDDRGDLVPDWVQGLPEGCQGTGALVVRICLWTLVSLFVDIDKYVYVCRH
jgi:hypothetical protein